MTAIEKRRTVLVVEDDADLLGMLQATLELAGYEVERAGDGLAALHEVRRATPDLAILDLNMPRMGGEDFLYAWRSGFETPGVPVIVITAQSRALRAQDLGVSACLPKPFDTNRLLACVADLLAVPSQARAAAGRDPRGVELAAVADDLADAPAPSSSAPSRSRVRPSSPTASVRSRARAWMPRSARRRSPGACTTSSTPRRRPAPSRRRARRRRAPGIGGGRAALGASSSAVAQPAARTRDRGGGAIPAPAAARCFTRL
jgi:two-component system chemotaxis response regulator CheY